MTISPFFRNLRTAYQAEIDDLAFDSDGRNILAQRLKQRRKELGFLISMLELSPEMVAVVLHKAFTFKLAGAIENVLQRDSDQLPDWDSVADTVTIAPWANELVTVILQQPQGEWFMTVAAALEYMFNRREPTGWPSKASTVKTKTRPHDEPPCPDRKNPKPDCRWRHRRRRVGPGELADTEGDGALMVVLEQLPPKDILAVIREYDNSKESIVNLLVTPISMFARAVVIEKQYKDLSRTHLRGMMNAVIFRDGADPSSF
jgi:hypothetical protein